MLLPRFARNDAEPGQVEPYVELAHDRHDIRRRAVYLLSLVRTTNRSIPIYKVRRQKTHRFATKAVNANPNRFLLVWPAHRGHLC